MRGKRRKGVPEGDDWLSTEQAAKLWNHITGAGKRTVERPISGQTMRSRCRDGLIEALGITVVLGGGRFYYISKRSLIEYLRGHAIETVERADEELLDD